MGEASTTPKRIVLTGASGFIGHHLQRRLLDDGHQVVALLRPGSQRADRILPGIERIEIPLDGRIDLGEPLASADLLIHCAGSVRGRTLSDFAPANVTAVKQLLDAARRAPSPPPIVLISSLAASRPHLSHYAASKRAGEQVLRGSGSDHWVILRPPAVYGPGDREMRPLLLSIRRGLAVMPGPVGQRLSVLHVSDLVAAVSAVIAHLDVCRGQIFDLDDGQPQGYGWPEIIKAARGFMPVLALRVPRTILKALAEVNLWLAGQLSYAPMLTPGKVRELSQSSWLCNNQRLSAATGWQPQLKLSEGVRATFAH